MAIVIWVVESNRAPIGRVQSGNLEISPIGRQSGGANRANRAKGDESHLAWNGAIWHNTQSGVYIFSYDDQRDAYNRAITSIWQSGADSNLASVFQSGGASNP